ncbi:MAG: glycosyltransferase family 4 protein [Oscillospiraceae bacterium]|jgi:glycosyltransferase EpsD|nr:glycosyltransferase family 4 protein [Oscillospiraceae bacterium]
MQKGKILFVASVERHLERFHVPYIRYLESLGYEIHTAASGENSIDCVTRHFDINIARSPFKARNIKAFCELKKIINDGDYKLIHCHTPNAGVLTRLAARKARKRGTIVAYTAHGFHFYKGAPAMNKLLYLNAERFCSKYTDYQWTINLEDYDAVSKYNFKCGKAFLTKGVGIDGEKFAPVSAKRKAELRRKSGIPENAFVLIYPAEFTADKNHKTLLRAMEIILKKHPDIFLLLTGDGKLSEHFKKECVKTGIANNVSFPGFVNDMADWYAMSDIDITPSVREGLATHVIEAMSMGLPSVATNIRGHLDLVLDGGNGFLVEPDDCKAMAERVFILYNDRELLAKLSVNAVKTSKEYHWDNVLPENIKLYKEMLGDE